MEAYKRSGEFADDSPMTLDCLVSVTVRAAGFWQPPDTLPVFSSYSHVPPQRTI